MRLKAKGALTAKAGLRSLPMSKSVEPFPNAAVTFRLPAVEDAAAIHALIDDARKPLDLNSVYCYMLLTTHFAPWRQRRSSKVASLTLPA